MVEAEPEPGLAPEPAKASDLVELPFYWAELNEGKLEFDAHDISMIEYEPIGTIEVDGWLVLARGDARIPGRLAHGRPFVVVSDAGQVEAKVEQVTLHAGDGNRVMVTLATDGPLAANANMLVFRANERPVDAKIRLPELVADSDPIVAKLLAGVNAALKSAKRGKARASELRVHRVTMQGDAHFVVAAQVFNGRDPDEAEEVPTALALADANGKIVAWIQPFDEYGSAYEVQLVLDLDGDGLDELIFLASYSEGAFWYYLRRSPSSPDKLEPLEIAGSGM